MKKIPFLLFVIFLISSVFPAFSTELTAGIVYDSHKDTFPVGTEFSLEETFEDNSTLSAGLEYRNAGEYSSSILYTKPLKFFIISGGLTYDIKTTGISPNITLGTGVVLKKFSFLAGSMLNINPDNIFKPDVYTCTADMIFDTSESIIDLSFIYTSENRGNGKTSIIGGGLNLKAYQNGVAGNVTLFTDVHYVNTLVAETTGFAIDAGMKLNASLSFMSFGLKVSTDIKRPEGQVSSQFPFCIGLSTGFKL